MQDPSVFLFQIMMCLLKVNGQAKCGDRCCPDFYKGLYGRCIECPLGTYGIDCTKTCSPQLYGGLCRSKCECPPNEREKWMNVTFILIGSGATLVAFGLLIYLKSCCTKREALTRDTNQSLDNYEDTPENEHIYQENISVHSSDEMRTNYCDLGSSDIYDNHNDLEGSLDVGARSYNFTSGKLDVIGIEDRTTGGGENFYENI